MPYPNEHVCRNGIRERRVVEDLEMRVVEDDDGGQKIKGYAAVFNELSQPLFGFREIIRKGAFKKTIKEADVRALKNHNPDFVLGRRSAGTLKLWEDSKGLGMEIVPPDTTWAKDLMVSIGRRDITQASFGFSTIKDGWAKDGETLVRELQEVRLFDVSVVTFPAYTQTEVHVRAVLDSFGIASDLLAAAIFKAQAEQVLSQEERRAIEVAREVLEGCLGTEPRHEPHSEVPPEPSVTRAHSEPAECLDPQYYLSMLKLMELVH